MSRIGYDCSFSCGRSNIVDLDGVVRRRGMPGIGRLGGGDNFGDASNDGGSCTGCLRIGEGAIRVASASGT